LSGRRAEFIRSSGGVPDEEACPEDQAKLADFGGPSPPNSDGASQPQESASSPAESKRESARTYAERGWPVFPCKPGGKTPITPAGFKDASTDPEQISRWWRDHPQANIGIATGAAGLVVIDVDVKNGARGLESWQVLREELGEEVAETAIVRTPSGGLHYVFRADGHRVRNSAGKLGPGLDVRADGGYVIAPGSQTPQGSYEWLADRTPAPLPACLVEQLAVRQRESVSLQAGVVIPIGQRNSTLTSLAGTMQRRGMSKAAIAAALHEENLRCAAPLPDAEVSAIATSVAAYEPASATAATDAEGDPLVHEAAHAALLKDEWRNQYRWAEHQGTWRHWTGRVWKAVAEVVVVAAAQKVLRRHYGRMLAQKQSTAEDKRLRTLHSEACRYTSVLGGLSFLKGECGFHTEVEEWDSNPYLLNCADGLLDLRTQELGPHDPEALCTKITRWAFADRESSGGWERHLVRCLPDADIRRQVHRDLGRALVGADLEESLPIWLGVGRNGKSTTARALLQGLGGYGTKAAPDLLIERRFEQHPTEIADLVGSRLVISEEVEEGKHLAEARVKDLTGGQQQKGRFMRGDFFTFEQTFTIFLLVNHRPVISGTDKGIWERLRLVPWTVSIPKAEQRPQEEMVAELVADGSWMLRWMVAGFADWQGDHHWVAAEVRAATDDYHAEQDRLLGFIRDACEERPTVQQPKANLYEAYACWCDTNDEQPLSKTDFGNALKSRGMKSKRVGHENVATWVGIRLRAGETQ
jgi:putative DNA primase/helicase